MVNLSWNLLGLVVFASQAVAYFRLYCVKPLVVERIDPLVSPGLISAHVHTVVGAQNVNFTTTYDELLDSECSTCQVKEDKSVYWVPSLYYHNRVTGEFTNVPSLGGATIYYIQRTASYAASDEVIHPFPEGFRMLAGDMLKRSYADTMESQAISFTCLNYSESVSPSYQKIPDVNCPNGLRAEVRFPNCWDGTSLDSSDHKSHVAYPSEENNFGTCPSSHPYRIMTLLYEFIFDTNQFKDEWHGTTHPFVFAMGDPTGYGFHGDFINGWEEETLSKVIKNCTQDSGDIWDCPDVLKEGTDILDLWTAPVYTCERASALSETVLGSVGDKLPGNNPIQYGPEDAVLYSYDSILPWNRVQSTSTSSSSTIKSSSSTSKSVTAATSTSNAKSSSSVDVASSAPSATSNVATSSSAVTSKTLALPASATTLSTSKGPVTSDAAKTSQTVKSQGLSSKEAASSAEASSSAMLTLATSSALQRSSAVTSSIESASSVRSSSVTPSQSRVLTGSNTEARSTSLAGSKSQSTVPFSRPSTSTHVQLSSSVSSTATAAAATITSSRFTSTAMVHSSARSSASIFSMSYTLPAPIFYTTSSGIFNTVLP